MEVIVFTTPSKFSSELKAISVLFDAGLETLHVRKSKFSSRKMRQFIGAIPKKYHNRLVLHSHHHLALKYGLKGIHLNKKERDRRWHVLWKRFIYKLRSPRLLITASFHSLQSLVDNEQNFDYVFLSPVFDSASKKGRVAAFNYNQLELVLTHSKYKVMALGV